MNLKRIIKEEMNDSLGWINDIKPALNMDEEWILVNDVNPNSIEESIKIQKYLFNLGYKWFSSELIKDTIYSIHHFPSKSLRGDLTYYNNKKNERNLADKEIERNNNVYYWSQIKPKLNESDELQWIKEPRKNDLDGLKLGYHPIHKENPMVVIDNGEREVIIRTHGNGDFKYDRRTVKAFIERGSWDIITESDELQWIKDIKPTPSNPQKGLIYQFYNYPDSLYNENIKTDNIIITAVVDDKVYFDTINRYWANHPSDPGSDMMDKKAFSRMVNSGDIKYIGPSRVNESEEDDPLQWMKDINPIPELKIGSCIIDVMDSTQTKWHIKSFDRTLGGTPVIEVINDFTATKKLNRERFEEDLYQGRYKPCNKLMESNELDWIRDIAHQLPMDKDWWLINDVDPHSLELSREIQDFLFNQGFTWLTGKKEFVPYKFSAISHRGGTYDRQEGMFGYYPTGKETAKEIEEYEAENGEIYYWSQLSKGDFN